VEIQGSGWWRLRGGDTRVWVVETQGWRYRALGGRDSGVEIQGSGC